MGAFQNTIRHLQSNVLEAAKEYLEAEEKLSQAEVAGTWDKEGTTAKRKAAELAIAIDGLSDRAALESGLDINVIRKKVSALCYWPGSDIERPQAFENYVSARLPLDKEDQCPEDVFNHILWRAVKGSQTPYPDWAVKVTDED